MTHIPAPSRYATIEEKIVAALPSFTLPVTWKFWSNRLSSGATFKGFGFYLNLSFGRTAKPKMSGRYDRILGRYLTVAEAKARDAQYDRQLQRAYTPVEAAAHAEWIDHMARID